MGLQFENSFTVALSPEDAWVVLLDVPRMAKCLPGAALTEAVDEKTFKGNVNVKVGPVALTFAGTATFTGNKMMYANGPCVAGATYTGNTVKPFSVYYNVLCGATDKWGNWVL